MTDVLTASQMYETYKNAGVEWLGDIPNSWNVKPGMVAFSENKRNNKGMKEDRVLSLSYGNIVIKPPEKLTGLVPESFETYQLVEPGDIIIRCMDLQNDKESLRIGLAKDAGIITSAYLNLKVKDGFDSKYLYYYFHALDITKVIYKFGSGLRQNLSYEDFRRLPIFEIQEQEQSAIANFLDRKTAQIDQAIAIKEKQIALLKERRQILIQNAVTRGLDPDVPMKDSSVEWIGEIPEHWEVRRVKSISRVRRGASPRPIDDPKYFNEEGKYSWVRIADVTANDHYLVSAKEKMSKLGASKSVKLKPGSLFLSIAGSVGKPMISKIYCCIHDGFVYFPDLNENHEYLYRLFDCGGPYVGLGKHGTQLNLNTDTVGNIYIPWPLKEETEEIVKYADLESERFGAAIALQQNQIEKLKEYKSTLINSAVTGKIKVT